VKVIVTALAAAALAATALVAPTATAAPAPAAEPTARTVVKKTFSFYAKFTSRQVAPYGNAKAIGDLTITQGTVSDMAGKKVGTLTTVLRVVAPSPKKDAELRDTQSQIQLKDGQIFAQSVNEDPKGKPPVDLHVMPVTGGTGAYASARGTLLMRKVGDKYLMAYDIFVDKDLKAQTFTFDNIVEAAHQGSAPQGIGDVSLLRATGATNSYVLIATRAGDARGIVTDAVDMQVVTATGSLFARTIARGKAGPAQSSTFAVLGGTGSLSGYRGELTLSANGRSITAKLAAPSGSAKPLTWFEDAGRSPATVEIPGGTFLGVGGSMFKAAGDKKKSGDYFASRIEYDEIDGVTPVLTMLEQEFKTGTMIVTGITLSTGEDGAPVWRPIVGGTGDFGGAAGQVSSAQQSPTVWRKTGRFWR
jgi:hypothetical protein